MTKFDHIILIVLMIMGATLLVFFSDIEANQPIIEDRQRECKRISQIGRMKLYCIKDMKGYCHEKDLDLYRQEYLNLMDQVDKLCKPIKKTIWTSL